MSDKVNTEVIQKYMNSCLDRTPLEEITKGVQFHDEQEYTNFLLEHLLAQQLQTTMQLSKMNTLLMIATGNLDEDIPDGVAEISATDTPKVKVDSRTTVCGKCGKGVVPDRLNYCPNCKQDLTRQLMAEGKLQKDQ
jgi:hypothetical protein